MSGIVSFFSAAPFKDRIWRIYSSEFLRHSRDVLKLMLQARQTELEIHHHQDSKGLYHGAIKCQNKSKWTTLSMKKPLLLHCICVHLLWLLSSFFLLNFLSLGLIFYPHVQVASLQIFSKSAKRCAKTVDKRTNWKRLKSVKPAPVTTVNVSFFWVSSRANFKLGKTETGLWVCIADW